MFISAVVFLISLILHIAAWLDVEMQLYTVTRVLFLVMILLYLPACVIASRLRSEYGKKAFLAALKSVFPGWIAALMGFLIMYAIVVIFIQIVRKGDSAIALTALLTAVSSTAIGTYYSYNRLTSSDNGHFPKGDNESYPSV
jgi:membrane-bound acyltransferase YfiQ involved in biofilm formation